MSFILGKGERTWGRSDGVYSFRKHVKPLGHLPDDARMVMFHGNVDPWGYQAQVIPWVRENWK